MTDPGLSATFRDLRRVGGAGQRRWVDILGYIPHRGSEGIPQENLLKYNIPSFRGHLTGLPFWNFILGLFLSNFRPFSAHLRSIKWEYVLKSSIASLFCAILVHSKKLKFIKTHSEQEPHRSNFKGFEKNLSQQKRKCLLVMQRKFILARSGDDLRKWYLWYKWCGRHTDSKI